LESVAPSLIAFGMLASCVLLLGIAVRVAQHKDPRTLAPLLISRSRRMTPLFGLLAGIALWAGAYGLELLLDDRLLSVWMHRLVYLGTAITPPAVLLTALEASGHRAGRTGERLLWTFLIPIPVVTTILVLTNDHQALVWAPVGLRRVGSLSPVATVIGPWYWVHTAFSYACLTIACALLVRHYLRRKQRPREAFTVLVALLLPWMVNAHLVFWRTDSSIDLTPAAFLVTVLLLYRLVRRDILTEVLPVARATVLEALDDAVLVVDEESRILDANHSALALLGELQPDFQRFPPPSLAACWPELAELLQQEDPASRGIAIRRSSGETRNLDVWVTQLQAQPEVGPLRAIALRDITDRRRAEQELFHTAHFDGLTGLPNRKRFFDNLAVALDAAQRRGHCLAVLFLDLDQFKLVNDTEGHAAGDILLRTVAAQLLRGIRGSDTVARITAEDQGPEIGRLGGDEFAIVLPRIASAEDAGDVGARILKELEEPSRGASEAAATTSASIGIAIFPDDGRDADTLLKHADVALYHAKQSGGNHYQYFHSRLNQIAQRRAAIDRELRRAIGSDQMRLVYQPKLRMSGGEVVGLEALLRWSNPELGNVSPAEFIPIAEKTGLIQPLGRWVIDQVCRQVRAWRETGLSVPPVAVNVSSIQLGNPRFVETVTDCLRRHELMPNVLEMEITERTLLENDENAFATLRELRASGVPIALDDFGTGYSVLASLKRFDIDLLKIDSSLLEGVGEDERAAGVVSSVISLAHSLSMKVVAEGVEREDSAEVLSELGCDEVQGFLYSEPLPPSELSTFLGSERSSQPPFTAKKPDA